MTNTQSKWEERFNEEFEYADFPKTLAGNRSDIRIKSFIASEINQAKREEREVLIEKIRQIGGDWKKASSYDQYNAAEYIADFLQSLHPHNHTN